MTASLRVRLLGTPSVSIDGESLAIRGEIPRALVARLALAAGDYLSADALIADLWSDPPETVLSSLRAHASRLRALGLGTMLKGGRSGYALDLDRGQVDLLEHRDAVAAALAATDEEAYERLVAAERLWSEPLAGLEAFPFATRVREEAMMLAREASERLAELRLERGEEGQAVLAMSELRDRHPYDERPLLLLSRALARSGRITEALDEIDSFATAATRRGEDVSESVSVLRQQILRQDPTVLGSAGAGTENSVRRVGIPIPLTRFVGRERELALVERGRGESRLITLVGPAGVGKTRLAIETARRASSAVDDEQYLLDLTAIEDPGAALPALATTVGASEPSFAAVAARLTGRRSLLVVDNAEHLIGIVAAIVAELLRRCEGLSVIVTSREALRTVGERVVPVEPFSGASERDGVELFLQRATDVTGSSGWVDEDRDRIASICRGLDGLPLALELAAARLDVLTLAELEDGVRDGAAAHGDGRGRHGSLENAIDWSVRLLSDKELALLSQLAAFAAPFTLDEVAGVCDVGGGERELAVSLARKSLLSAQAGESGVRRFRLLLAVARHVERHHRLEPESLERWRARHLTWLRDFTREQTGLLRTREAKRARAALQAVRADIASALRTAVDSGDRASALEIVSGWAWALFERGAYTDALASVERALAVPGARAPDLEVLALYPCTYITSLRGDWTETSRLAVALASAAASASAPGLQALGAALTADLAAAADEEASALEALEDADRALAAPGVPPWLRADVLTVRADALRALGRPAAALESLGEAHRIGESTGHLWATKSAAYVTAKIMLDLRRGKDAVEVLRLRVSRSLETDDPVSALSAIAMMACACSTLERHELGATLLGGVDVVGPRFGYAMVSEPFFPERRNALRAALPADRYDAAYAKGRALGFGELVQLAQTFR